MEGPKTGERGGNQVSFAFGFFFAIANSISPSIFLV